jgi:two-component system response regulator BaeR
MNMSIEIAIVEDEPELAGLVADYARAAGYTPAVFHDGALALDALRRHPPGLVVLDLMLPGLDGLALCRALRAHASTAEVPVIMVTARVEEIDRLLGLEAGADDYLCKPFSPRELMARIKAILRRSARGTGSTPAAASVAAAPPVAIDAAARRIAIHGHALDLTPTEYGILAALARRPGQVFSRAQLLDLAREGNASLDVTDRAIDSHVKNLRRKLDAAMPGAEPIHSIYGLGYRFDL